MSKNNKRFKKKLKSDFSIHYNSYDQHHLLWSKNKWNSGYAQKLRDHWFFKIDLPMATLHKTIHNRISNIPVPTENECKNVLMQLDMFEYMHPKLMKVMIPSKRLKWLIGTLSNDDSETVKALKRQLKYLEDNGY